MTAWSRDEGSGVGYFLDICFKVLLRPLASAEVLSSNLFYSLLSAPFAESHCICFANCTSDETPLIFTPLPAGWAECKRYKDRGGRMDHNNPDILLL